MRIPDFVLTQTCTIKPYLGQTPKGKQYGTEYSSKCRFESHRKKYTSNIGKEFISNGRLFLNPDENNLSLSVDSLVIIDGQSHTIMQKTIQRGFQTSHVECVVV